MQHPTLKQILNSKKALSSPVGNLIMLLAAVILSTTVVIFAINVMTVQAEKERVYVAYTHIWYINSQTSIAAIALTDTGPTDVILTKINIKGLDCQWNGADNYVVYCTINGTIPGDLQYPTNLSPTTPTTITLANQPYQFTPATSALTLQHGNTLILYITIPNTIMLYNLSEPLRIVINTTQSVYIAETQVQVAQ
jgi:hypothetical protein